MMHVGLRQPWHSGPADLHECRPEEIAWLPGHEEATTGETVGVSGWSLAGDASLLHGW